MEIHAKKPTNIPELRLFCKEEWAKIPPSQCAGLINSYRKHLVEVIAEKGGHAFYWKRGFTYFCLTQICKIGSFPSICKWISSLYLVLVLLWKSDHFFNHINAEIEKNLKGSQTFKNHCTWTLARFNHVITVYKTENHKRHYMSPLQISEHPSLELKRYTGLWFLLKYTAL